MTGGSGLARAATLLAIAVALAGSLWVGGRRGAPARALGTDPLLRDAAEAVRRVDVIEPGRHLTALRAPGGWVDVDGRPWEGAAVGDLVDTLGTLRPLMLIDTAPRAPAEYGLGGDAARVELAAADGRVLLALDVGDRNPAHTGMYVRRTGRREIVLVGGLLAWELDKLRAAAPAAAP
jgi:uncharacterized protein DUF4340